MKREIDTDRYLRGDMSADELQRFEADMTREPTLAESVALERALVRAIFDQGVEAMKLRMDVLDSRQDRGGGKIQFFRNRYRSAAFALAIAAIVSILVAILLPQPKGDLYGQYFEGYPNYEQPSVRGEGDPGQARAYQLYDSGNFEAAALAFEQKPADSMSIADRFYLGQSYLQSDHPDKAQAFFLAVSTEESPYQEAGTWYLALTQLKLGAYTEAVLSLEQLRNSDDWGERANALLAKLEGN